jgi:K+-sensing histidine kinase KdpD
MPTEHDTNRADRLLRKMHPVFSHDLPNQVVALQSLLQMLEGDRIVPLSVQEQETLQRLHRVAGKTSTMVRFLRELGRLNSYVRRVEAVRLAGVIREVSVELQQYFPEAPLPCELNGDVKAVVADPRLLKQALVEILRCLIDRRGAASALRLEARGTMEGTELRGELVWVSGPSASNAQGLPPDRAPLDQRPEIGLAQELLAAWGGRLTEVREVAEVASFTVVVPSRSAHD